MKKMKRLLSVVLFSLLAFGIFVIPAEAASKQAVKSIAVQIGKKNITKKTYKMKKGKTVSLTVKVKPTGSKKAVKFSSGNKKIVSISSKGKIKAKKEGTAKITIKVKGKNGKTKKTWVKIKVENKGGAATIPDTGGNSWENWNDAYRDFVLNEKFLKSGQEYGADDWEDFDPYIRLYDMDTDGIPELIINNGYSGRTMRWAYIYTYTGSRVKYLAIGPTDAFYIPGSKFSGIFGCYNVEGGEMHWTYYHKSGNRVDTEDIGYADWDDDITEIETDNEELLEEFSKEKVIIEGFCLSDIREMGWDSFTEGTSVSTTMSGDCGKDGDNVKWKLEPDGDYYKLIISGRGEMEDYNGWGADEDERAPWYRYGWMDDDSIRTIDIKKGVTHIGDWAFTTSTRHLSNEVRNINIADSVISIGEGGLSNFGGTGIDIPDSVTTIGPSAFWGCYNLTSISIPESVAFIGEGAFSDCVSLVSITIPGSVSSIGEDIFNNCSDLEDIYYGGDKARWKGYGKYFVENTSEKGFNVSYWVTGTGPLTFHSAKVHYNSKWNSGSLQENL